MAAYNTNRASHKTLAGTTVDTATLGGPASVKISNRDATNPLWVTIGSEAAPPANPVANADDIYVVAPNSHLTIKAVARQGKTQVKILGNGGSYSVEKV